MPRVLLNWLDGLWRVLLIAAGLGVFVWLVVYYFKIWLWIYCTVAGTWLLIVLPYQWGAHRRKIAEIRKESVQ